MNSLVVFGCFLLFWSASHIECSPIVADNPLMDKVETILRNTNLTMHSLEDMNVRLSAIEEAIKKLGLLSNDEVASNKSCQAVSELLTNYFQMLDVKLNKVLKEMHRMSANESSDQTHIPEIVAAIRSGRLKKADELLVEIGSASDIPKIVDQLYGKCERNIELIVDFAKSASKITYSYDILSSLYQLMKENGHHETSNLILITSTLQSQIVDQDKDSTAVKMQANLLISELSKAIKTDSLNLMKSVIETDHFNANFKAQELAATLAAHLPELSDEVMRDLVDSTFQKVDSFTILTNIFSLRNTSQAVTGISALYWKVKETGKYSNDLMLDLAHKFAQLQGREDFKVANKSRQDALDSLVATIPACARNLFFQPKVCLWSKAKQSNLIAANSSLNYDRERRNIFTHHPATNELLQELVPFGASWYVQKVADNVLLKSVDFEYEYLYAAAISNNRTGHYVFNWIPGRNTDPQSAWKFELDGDQCLIKSAYLREYLCASDVKSSKDDQYSSVFTCKTYVDDSKETSDSFVWQVRGC